MRIIKSISKHIRHFHIIMHNDREYTLSAPITHWLSHLITSYNIFDVHIPQSIYENQVDAVHQVTYFTNKSIP